MFDKIKANRKYFFIGLGLILIVAGLVSNISTYIQNHAPQTTGAFRFVERMSQSQTVKTVIDQSVTSTTSKAVLIEKNSLDANSLFIHTKNNKLLEVPLIPEKIEIPSINLVAPVVIASFNYLDVEGETFGQWLPSDSFAAAWQPDSALLGSFGNTVINGHHNVFGKVFGKLIDLESGDVVYVYAKGKKYTYVIANKMILLERGQPLEVRTENARWLDATDDERLTLVTCWPASTNTHRLILVARPKEN